MAGSSKHYEGMFVEKGRQKVVQISKAYILEKPEITLIRPNEDEQILLTGKDGFEFTIPVYPRTPMTIRHAKPEQDCTGCQ